MAAIDPPAGVGAWATVMAAAMALPGVAVGQVAMDTEDSASVIGFKWLSYRDWQPGFDRISVAAPSVFLSTAITGAWRLEAAATVDSVSGASPRYHTSVSGASSTRDQRSAADVRISRVEDGAGWTVGLVASDESDYRARTVSGDLRWSTPDNNRTWKLGAAISQDQITSVNDPQLSEDRNSTELSAGLTQVVSRHDVAQVSLGLVHGQGFYSDPYKLPDVRPRVRDQGNLILRWNHYIEVRRSALRMQYRYYKDSFGVESHAVGTELAIEASARWTVTPSVRLYSQDAARFYYNPVTAYLGVPLPAGYQTGTPISADQRLSAFGAATLGLKLEWRPNSAWTIDLKLERYEQRTAWHWITRGSRGLAPLSASFIQWGVQRKF